MFLRKFTSFVLLIVLFFSYGIRDFIVYALSPIDIPNKVFFLDTQDIDGDGISANQPADGTSITAIIDKFNTNTGTQIELIKQPIFNTNSINNFPSLSFDGNNDLLNLADNLDISVGTGYTEKSYVMIIKTGNDINTFQTIYDEGTKEKGFSFQIENGNIYAGAYNTLDWINPNRTINLGPILANEIYTIIFVYSKTGDFIKAYLNGNIKGTINSIETQTTYGACTFETSFDCAIYSTGGTLAIGSTKNDTLKLSNSTQSVGLELNFFKGNIGEISSYNYALSDIEVNGLNDYLFAKWGFDITAPIISTSNISNNQILPGGNHSIEFNYSDEIGGTGIDINSTSITLEKWNGTNWITNTSIVNTTTTTTNATYDLINLDFGKYRTIFNISDNIGNTSLNFERIFYIDIPQMTVSTANLDIGVLNDISNTFAGDIIITVKTIGAPFRVKIKKNQILTDNTETIPYYNGVTGFGFDKNNDGSLSDIGINEIIGQEVLNINTSGNLNTYTYTVKIGAIIDKLQSAGNYSGQIDFDIDLDY